MSVGRHPGKERLDSFADRLLLAVRSLKDL